MCSEVCWRLLNNKGRVISFLLFFIFKGELNTLIFLKNKSEKYSNFSLNRRQTVIPRRPSDSSLFISTPTPVNKTIIIRMTCARLDEPSFVLHATLSLSFRQNMCWLAVLVGK